MSPILLGNSTNNNNNYNSRLLPLITSMPSTRDSTPSPSPSSSSSKQELLELELLEDEDEEAKSLNDFFTPSITSMHDSTEYSTTAAMRRDRTSEVVKIGGNSRDGGSGEIRNLKKRNGKGSTNSSATTTRDSNRFRSKEVNVSKGIDQITSPILPKVKLAFPTIMSDEEEEDLPIWNGLSSRSNGRRGIKSSDASEEGGRGGSPYRSRTWSQNSQTSTTTTTTTTLRTKQTEHRSYRYSMPSFNAAEDEYCNQEVNPRSHSSTGGRYSTPISSTRNSANSSSQIPFPSSTSTSNSNPRRTTTTCFHNPTPRSTKTSIPIRENRRSSPLPPSTTTTTTTTTPSKSKSTASNNPFDSFFHKRPSLASSNRTSSYHSYPSDSPSLDSNSSYKLSSSIPNRKSNSSQTSFRNPSLPLIAPLLNMFMFFIVTSIACCSISAALAAGFGLTLYDDCGRRVKLLREGIEGVSLSNVGRIVGSAVGEWAKEATKRLKAGSSSNIGGGRRRMDRRVEENIRRNSEEENQHHHQNFDDETNALPTTFESELEQNLDGGVGGGGGGGGGRYKNNYSTRNTTSRSRSRLRKKSNSPAPTHSSPLNPASPSGTGTSLVKRFSNSTRFLPRFFGVGVGSTRSNLRNSSTYHTQGVGEDWYSDEDNLPFEVPTSTPHHSRPSSPPLSPPLSTTSSSAASNSNNNNNKIPLPPRPPLALLVPSILFALVYTILKVVFDYWRGDGKRRGGSTT